MPSPPEWNTCLLYQVKRERDQIDRLYLTGQLAGFGLTASDSVNDIVHMQSDLEGFFEVIHRLAGKAAEIAEHEQQKPTNKSAPLPTMQPNRCPARLGVTCCDSNAFQF